MTTPSIAEQLKLLVTQCDRRLQNGRCTRAAKYVVSVHVIDQCRSGPYTPAGDHVSVLCEGCTRFVTSVVCRKYRRMIDAMEPGFWPTCETCHKPFHRLADFITVEHV